MKYDVLRISPNGKETVSDCLAEESFLTIRLNGEELLTLLCTPADLEELSAGFLYSAGLIQSYDDIVDISVDTVEMASDITLKAETKDLRSLFKRVYTSGCGRGMLFYNVLDLSRKNPVTANHTIDAVKITGLMKVFEKKSGLFKKTGAVHSSALSDGDNILSFFEDIGRHNSLDKVIGDALFNRLKMDDLIVLTSGRVSSEMMYKVQKMRSGIIVSRSAPTALAVQLAERMNITLIGFARGKRMNVYTVKERIVRE